MCKRTLASSIFVFCVFCSWGCGSGTTANPLKPSVSQTTPAKQPSPPAGGVYTMSGVVRREDFAGTPLENAKVQILNGPRAGAFAVTDVTGTYHIPDVPPGQLQVRASKDGYESNPDEKPEGSPADPGWSFSFNPNRTLDLPLYPAARVVSIGETVSDMTSRDGRATVCVDEALGTRYACQRFIVTAPAGGTLTARLTWDAVQTRLLLVINLPPPDFFASQYGTSPLTAAASVTAGSRYHIDVWDSGAGNTFALTTTLEQK